MDFLAPELNLVVEVDGGYHDRTGDADTRRDRALARAGYTVLRIDAEVVMRDTERAVALVSAQVARLRAGSQHKEHS